MNNNKIPKKIPSEEIIKEPKKIPTEEVFITSEKIGGSTGAHMAIGELTKEQLAKISKYL